MASQGVGEGQGGLYFGDYGTCNLSQKKLLFFPSVLFINAKREKVGGGLKLSFVLDPSIKVWD